MKFKKLTKEQIIISLDRLTRFKKTKEKYIRVFSDIIVSNLIEPKLKKNEIENMDKCYLSDIISEIFNTSLEGSSNSLVVNNILKNYENNTFYNDEETQMLLNNKIDYSAALKYISENAPINLKWLKSLIRINTNVNLDEILINNRKIMSLKFPIEKIILVEGITEEILLPKFAGVLGYDFDKNGIQIIPAGGKSKVVKMYYKLREELKLPIFVLLDRDAEENINEITPRLRKYDKVHLVSCGEFEDLLPKSLIVRTVNSEFKNFLKIKESDIISELPTVKTLEELFKTKGLHEFKKTDFAKLVSSNIIGIADITDEIKAIIYELSEVNKSLDTQSFS